MRRRNKQKNRLHRRDASESVWLASQLEFQRTKAYDRKFPMLKARQFVPLATDIPRTTDVVVIHGYSQFGLAKFISAYADDLPSADVKADETTAKVRTIGISYQYSDDEIEKAQANGVNLPEKKAAAARRGTEIVIDRVLASGDSAQGLLGLTNQSNALTYTIPDGNGGSPTWDSKTPAEILADLVGIYEYVVTQTNENEIPNVMLMPRAKYIKIRTTQFSVASDKTILEWFQALYPGVHVDQWQKLAAAGTASTDRIMCYVMDSDHLEGIVPQEFTQKASQERNLAVVVPCKAKVGGVALYYPLSMVYADGA